MTGPSTSGMLAGIAAGPIVWAVHLFVVYAGHAVVCATGAPPQVADALIAVATAAAALAVGVLMVAPEAVGIIPPAEGQRTYRAVARLLSALAFVAILWAGATALVVTSCVPTPSLG